MFTPMFTLFSLFKFFTQIDFKSPFAHEAGGGNWPFFLCHIHWNYLFPVLWFILWSDSWYFEPHKSFVGVISFVVTNKTYGFLSTDFLSEKVKSKGRMNQPPKRLPLILWTLQEQKAVTQTTASAHWHSSSQESQNPFYCQSKIAWPGCFRTDVITVEDSGPPPAIAETHQHHSQRNGLWKAMWSRSRRCCSPTWAHSRRW